MIRASIFLAFLVAGACSFRVSLYSIRHATTTPSNTKSAARKKDFTMMAGQTFPDMPADIKLTPRRFLKRTKQLATLGPASSSFEMIEKLFLSGADIFRLNFSHGEHAEKAKLVEVIRAVESKYDHPICILADLQGPKLRVGKFEADEKVFLKDGQSFTFDLKDIPGNVERVQLPHPEILNTLNVGDTVLLDDGKLRMQVR